MHRSTCVSPWQNHTEADCVTPGFTECWAVRNSLDSTTGVRCEHSSCVAATARTVQAATVVFSVGRMNWKTFRGCVRRTRSVQRMSNRKRNRSVWTSSSALGTDWASLFARDAWHGLQQGTDRWKKLRACRVTPWDPSLRCVRGTGIQFWKRPSHKFLLFLC